MKNAFTPFHIHHLATNIARHEAYLNQIESVKARGVRVIEIRTKAPPVDPGSLGLGPKAYEVGAKDGPRPSFARDAVTSSFSPKP